MSYGKIEIHNFYCISCGNKGIPCVRPRAHQRERFHRKKLYCPNCKKEIQHIEICNEEEAFLFKQAFEAGEYLEENQESLKFLGQISSI